MHLPACPAFLGAVSARIIVRTRNTPSSTMATRRFSILAMVSPLAAGTNGRTRKSWWLRAARAGPVQTFVSNQIVAVSRSGFSQNVSPANLLQ